MNLVIQLSNDKQRHIYFSIYIRHMAFCYTFHIHLGKLKLLKIPLPTTGNIYMHFYYLAAFEISTSRSKTMVYFEDVQNDKIIVIKLIHVDCVTQMHHV